MTSSEAAHATEMIAVVYLRSMRSLKRVVTQAPTRKPIEENRVLGAADRDPVEQPDRPVPYRPGGAPAVLRAVGLYGAGVESHRGGSRPGAADHLGTMEGDCAYRAHLVLERRVTADLVAH